MNPKTHKVEVKVDEHQTRIFIDGVELRWVKSITLHQEADIPLMSVSIDLWTEDVMINGDAFINLNWYQFVKKGNPKYIEEINKEKKFLEGLVENNEKK